MVAAVRARAVGARQTRVHPYPAHTAWHQTNIVFDDVASPSWSLDNAFVPSWCGFFRRERPQWVCRSSPAERRPCGTGSGSYTGWSDGASIIRLALLEDTWPALPISKLMTPSASQTSFARERSRPPSSSKRQLQGSRRETP